MKNSDHFSRETDFPDLDGEGAVRRLREAIRFETVSYLDPSRVRAEEFDRLHAHLRKSYPKLCEKAKWETIGKSLLLTLPGTNASLPPALFMAHQDVVPVVPGTEKDWIHPPFSGDLADGFVWGRGAIDIKEMLVGILESAEYLLEKGETFCRTVYLAFGEDEETQSAGAKAIVQTLRSRGVRLEFVLDEGAGQVTEASEYGAPGVWICPIGIYEKGYMDLKFSVASRGGHSSNPFRGTSLGHLAKAIACVTDHPLPPHLTPAFRKTLEAIAPSVTREPMKTYLSDIDGCREEILSECLKKEGLYHQVQTTAAPTQITPGSPAGNVMPQGMEAVINFRLTPPDTPGSVFDYYRALLPDEVKMETVQAIAASRPSAVDSYGFSSLKRVLERYFEKLLFVPAQNRGATDARCYEEICPVCLRFGPFLEEEEIVAEGMHGTNERISVRAYLQGIRVLIRLMKETCVENL